MAFVERPSGATHGSLCLDDFRSIVAEKTFRSNAVNNVPKGLAMDRTWCGFLFAAYRAERQGQIRCVQEITPKTGFDRWSKPYRTRC
jgi:hypothetical protein